MKLLRLHRFASTSWSIEIRRRTAARRENALSKLARLDRPVVNAPCANHRLPTIARWVALLLLCVGFNCQAHKPSEAYLTLAATNGMLTGQWDVALRDLDDAVGLDENGDRAITWGEVRARHAVIAAYLSEHLDVLADARRLELAPGELLIDEHTDGAYAVLRIATKLPAGTQELAVRYELFFDFDPLHRGLLQLHHGEVVQTSVFGPASRQQTFTLARPALSRQFLTFVREGAHHIWIGIDHILFLLALLIPAVLWRPEPGLNRPVAPAGRGEFRAVLLRVLKLVTAFTIAHSLTLGLAALNLVTLPSRLVESVIAASVVVAAVNNLWPFFRDRAAWVVFAFGLVHGFGFASVLGDLGLPVDATALALAGFNLGVEAGQLVIVAAFLPVAFLLRSGWFYRRVVCVGGSALIAVVATGWLVERTFDLRFLPF